MYIRDVEEIYTSKFKNCGGKSMSQKSFMSEKNTYHAKIDVETCVSCGACVESCWRGIYEKGTDEIQIREDKTSACIGCLECQHCCPTGALQVEDHVLEKYDSFTKANITSFYELAEVRQSVRNYKAEEVPMEDIMKIIETVNLAPTIRNAQQFKIIVVDDLELRKSLINNVICHADDTGLRHANSFTKKSIPKFVLFVRESIKPGQINTAKPGFEINFDMGCLGAYFILQAAEMGIATCLIGRFDFSSAEKLFGLEEGAAAFIVAMGYPEKDYVRVKYRKELENFVCINEYK